jgi:hypothetical protein
MLTSQYAKSYPRLRVIAVDPGYTATDLNGTAAPGPSSRAPRSSCRWPTCNRVDPAARLSTCMEPWPRSRGDLLPQVVTATAAAITAAT